MSAPARIDFGWIKEAWALFSAQSGVWVRALLLSFLIYIGVWVLLAIPTGGLTQFQRASSYGLTHPPAYSSPAPTPRVYESLAERQVREILLAGTGAISVFGLFSALPQSLPLFLAGIVVPIIIAVVEGAAVWPLHRFLPHRSLVVTNNVYLGFSILLNGPLMLAPLLIIDGNASAADAITGSVRLLRHQLLRSIWFYAVTSFIGGIGFVLCGVGMLATYPVFLISIALAYLALTQAQPMADTPAFDPALTGIWPPPPRPF